MPQIETKINRIQIQEVQKDDKIYYDIEIQYDIIVNATTFNIVITLKEEGRAFSKDSIENIINEMVRRIQERINNLMRWKCEPYAYATLGYRLWKVWNALMNCGYCFC